MYCAALLPVKNSEAPHRRNGSGGCGAISPDFPIKRPYLIGACLHTPCSFVIFYNSAAEYVKQFTRVFAILPPPVDTAAGIMI